MRERGYGRIVNVASIAGKEGVPRISAYSAAKAGVIGFTKSLGKELAGSGVTANCIAPAITETDLFREMTPEHIAAMKAKIPMGRALTIPEIAAMVAWIAGPDCSFTTGFAFDLTGRPGDVLRQGQGREVSSLGRPSSISLSLALAARRVPSS